jgi:hypothetical protein
MLAVKPLLHVKVKSCIHGRVMEPFPQVWTISRSREV